MILRQKLSQKVYGYWDGGAKDTFNWEIESASADSKGVFCRIGSFEANHWFHVAQGKSDRQTLSYAMKHLRKSTRYPSTFEYIN